MTKQSKSSKSGQMQQLLEFIKSERFSKAVGIFWLILGLFLFIAFFSYLFTWKQDQSAVLQFSWSLIVEPNIKIYNFLGRFGAVSAHFFMYDLFGISSFLILAIPFSIGINKLVQKQVFSVQRISVFLMKWLAYVPFLLAYLFQKAESLSFVGGAIGNFFFKWSKEYVSNVGTGILLFGILITIVVIRFNINFNWLLKSDSIIKFEGSAFETLFKKPSEQEDVEKQVESPIQEEKEEITPNEDVWGKPVQPLHNISKEEESHDLDDIRLERVERNEPTQTTPPPQNESPKETSNSFKIEVAKGDESPEDSSPANQEEKQPEITIEKTKGDKQISIGRFVPEGYNPKDELPDYQYPPVSILNQYDTGDLTIDEQLIIENQKLIVKTLNDFKIDIKEIKATVGPTVILYELIPEAGIRISKITNIADDIALALSALGIRIIAPMPGKGTIGIEVPNPNPQMVSLRSVISTEKFRSSRMELPLALGKTITNETFIADLAKMPHLLIAGATGMGKSVGLNAILVSLLLKMHPSQLKLVLVDPKRVELPLYSNIEKHFLACIMEEEEKPIITDNQKVIKTVSSLCVEMDNRYQLLENAKTRNIKEYNEKYLAGKLDPADGHAFLPYIVLVIDEFADLIMTAGKDIEIPIARLAQLARATGIHLIIATQRPTTNIITGTIKANFPARIAFKVSQKIDSRTILDTSGAEQLIGKGDMLVNIGSDLVRVQCAFLDTPEVEKISEHIGLQKGYMSPFFLPEPETEESESRTFEENEQLDDLFEDAARLIVMHQQGSTSLIQRKLRLGYARAGRLMDQLEKAGICGPNLGSKSRDVLIQTDEDLERILQTLL